MHHKYNDIVLFLALVLLGILTRTVWHVGPNIEFVTGITMLGIWTLRSQSLKLLLPLAIMVGSDLIIGNSAIFMFTWSGFALIALLGLISRASGADYIKFVGGGIAGVIVFFLWTNLGVMLISGMYDHSLAGLVQSYANALPFLRNQLISNAIVLHILWLGLVLWEQRYSVYKAKQL